MDADFDDDDLAALEQDPRSTAGHGPAIDRGFRKAMQAIRSANDIRDLYVLKGLHFEKLKGARDHQHSLRINDKWRLIIELRNVGSRQIVRVMSIEDYH